MNGVDFNEEWSINYDFASLYPRTQEKVFISAYPRTIDKIAEAHLKQCEIIYDYYNKFPDPYKTQALNNLKHTTLKIEKYNIHNIKDSLHYGFDWYKSKEGTYYWYNFYKSLI